jgi:hypothetical protein
MFSSVSNIWLAQDLDAVALAQSTSGAGSLILDGNYSIPTSSTISFLNLGFARNVGISSTSNLSAVNFTISGVQNSTVVNETIVGPDNSTVYTTNAFDIISSVSVDAAITAPETVNVGTGLTGFFPLYSAVPPTVIAFPSSSKFSPFALSFATEAVNGATYAIYECLDNLSNNGQTYDTLITNSWLFPKGSPHVSTSQIIQFTDVLWQVLVKITSANSSSTLHTKFLEV